MKNDLALQPNGFPQQSDGALPGAADGAENDVRARIRRYIVDDLLLGTVDHVGDDESLSQSGILDSTGALELVAFLEESFGIAIEDHDLTPENLDTIDGAVALVGRKRAEAAVIGG